MDIQPKSIGEVIEEALSQDNTVIVIDKSGLDYSVSINRPTSEGAAKTHSLYSSILWAFESIPEKKKKEGEGQPWKSTIDQYCDEGDK